MKQRLIELVPLVIIVVLGLLLRVILFDRVPPALNIDEAALGYNAYSILKTGADEHGRFLPLSLESFGDWKLPAYSYLAVLPVALFGLSEFSIRLPSMLAGVAGIVLIYFLSIALFQRKSVALFTSLFFALSPWSIYFSRAAYEVNLATAFFLGALLLFILSLQKKKKNLLLLCSGVLFGLTLFTYHSFIVFTPLFVFAVSVIYRSKIGKKLIYLLAPFLLIVLVSAYSNYMGGGSKFSSTTIFDNQDVIYSRVENFKKDMLDNPILFDNIHTKYAGIPYQITQNYLLSFSPTFLFDRGGEKLVHNLDGFGNIYIFDALLLVVGFAGLFFYKEKKIPLLAVWLVLAPIPSALTLDAPNSTRLFILMPLFVLIAGYGAGVLFHALCKNLLGKTAFVVLSVLFIMNCLYFLNLYFIHFQYNRAQFWRYGYKKMVEISNLDARKAVIVRGPYEFPYIYFLFYNKYDPKSFINEVEYYPTNYEGFKYVREFGRYKFVEDLSKEGEKANTLYFDTQNFHDGDNVIVLPNGDPAFKYYEGKDN